MNWDNFLNKLGVGSIVLWGFAVGSAVLFFVERLISPIGFPQDWRWVLPVVVAVSWATLVAGLVSKGWPVLEKKWKVRQARKKREAYALQNLAIANDFERAVLTHYKRRNQQRFRARFGADAIHEMERQGLLINDSMNEAARVRTYKIPDAIWNFLDAPPQGWDRGGRLSVIDWE